MSETARQSGGMGDPDRVVVRDKRRLDPETGEVRAPAPDAAEPVAAAPPQPAAAATHPDQQPGQDQHPGQGEQPGQDQLPGQDQPSAAHAAPAEQVSDPVADLTDTLQRVQAEYSNYRKRVERDRVAMIEQATGTLLAQLLPLLDDVERARQHDDLAGAFRTVGEGLEAVAVRLGLERYGAPGEPFDPQVHEAVMQAEPDAAFTVATCAQVFRPGFRVGGRVLRAAQVAVADPAS